MPSGGLFYAFGGLFMTSRCHFYDFGGHLYDFGGIMTMMVVIMMMMVIIVRKNLLLKLIVLRVFWYVMVATIRMRVIMWVFVVSDGNVTSVMTLTFARIALKNL